MKEKPPKTETVLTEGTSKKIKLHIAIGTAIFLLGGAIVVMALPRGSNLMGTIGWYIFIVGLVYLLVAKFIQWWKHE